MDDTDINESHPPIEAKLPTYKRTPRDRNWDKQTLQAMVDCYQPVEIMQWLAECYAVNSGYFGSRSQERIDRQELAIFYGQHAVDKLMRQK